MGFRFRKSVGKGPFRINFSKSGIGYSVGGKGFRFTKKANGGYRTTTSVPGTGVSYVKDFGDSSKGRSKKNTPNQDGVVNHNTEPSMPPEQPRNKKPWYRRWWVYVIAALIVIGAVSGNKDSSTTEPPADNDTIVENTDTSTTTDAVVDELPEAEPEQDTAATELEDPAAEEEPEAPATEQPEEQTEEQPAAPEETTDAVAPVTPPVEPVVEQPTQQPAEEPSQSVTEPATEPEPVETMVWVTKTGKRYHSIPDCGNTKSASQIPLSQAQNRGLEPCANCH